MRLRTCVILEAGALMGIAAAAMIVIGVLHTSTSQTPTLTSAQASGAAQTPLAPSDQVLPDAGPMAAVPDAPTALTPPSDASLAASPAALRVAPDPAWTGPFSPAIDEELLAPLRAESVTTWKTNTGGTSLSLRVEVTSGARAAFKPEQIHGGSNPRREIAAYRIDRLLGIGRVPPSLGRTFDRADFVGLAESPAARARFDEEAIAVDGTVRGELSWWVPVLVDPTIDGYALDDTNGIVTWRKWLMSEQNPPEAKMALLAQISDLTAFDFVIGNVDRWTGGNLKSNKEQTQIYFIDNTMAFAPDSGTGRTLGYLQRVGKFSRKFIARLRALTSDEIHAAIADAAPFDYLLTNDEVAGIMRRRDVLLAYVDGLIAKYGEAKVMAFP